MENPKIPYTELQKQYPNKIIALSLAEDKVVAAAKTFPALLRQLKKLNIDPQDCVYLGPIPKYGTIKI